MPLKDIITYINSSTREERTFSTTEDEAQFYAKIHYEISMPFGQFLKKCLHEQKEPELKQLGMGNDLMYFLKEAMHDESLQKFIDRSSPVTTPVLTTSNTFIDIYHSLIINYFNLIFAFFIRYAITFSFAICILRVFLS